MAHPSTSWIVPGASALLIEDLGFHFQGRQVLLRRGTHIWVHSLEGDRVNYCVDTEKAFGVSGFDLVPGGDMNSMHIHDFAYSCEPCIRDNCGDLTVYDHILTEGSF